MATCGLGQAHMYGPQMAGLGGFWRRWQPCSGALFEEPYSSSYAKVSYTIGTLITTLTACRGEPPLPLSLLASFPAALLHCIHSRADKPTWSHGDLDSRADTHAWAHEGLHSSTGTSAWAHAVWGIHTCVGTQRPAL